ncbi:MAG: hypothetical protein R3D59_05655 [Paracoccaceae bacterium]
MHANMVAIRNQYYTAPGPASTGVPIARWPTPAPRRGSTDPAAAVTAGNLTPPARPAPTGPRGSPAAALRPDWGHECHPEDIHRAWERLRGRAPMQRR